MKLSEVNVKSLLAIFIIVFGMCVIVFVHLEDMVLGAIIGFIGVPLSYFFGASNHKQGTTNIKDSNVYADDGDIGGGGIKNPPPKPPEDKL